MKVRDLISQLSKLNPNLEVCCVEDGPVPLRNDYPGPFEITSVESQRVVTGRNASGVVMITFDHTQPGAIERAIIGITSDI